MTRQAQQAWTYVKHDPDIAFRARVRWIVGALDPGPTDRILDAGSGLGFYLSVLGHVSASEVVGLEVDGGRLRSAGRLRSGISRVQGDLLRLPFADSSFDKVLISEVLEHLPDEGGALSELHRVLRPGGALVATVPHNNYTFCWDPLNWARERLSLGHFTSRPWSGIWTDHVRLYSRERLQATLAGAGFQPTDSALFTRWSLPMAHFLVYEVGQRLLKRRELGDPQRNTLWGHGPSRPIKWATAIFTFPDRFNLARGYRRGSAVSLCVRATRLP